jgi:uncharacterized membrane protein YedE/YeeE
MNTHQPPAPPALADVDLPQAGLFGKDGIVSAVGYLLVGGYFGVVLIKGQVADWFRVQEMFRLQQFHMFGVIGSAIVVAMISLRILKRLGVRASNGEAISIPIKQPNKGQVIGGVLFGLGWAATGACPGPLYAQFGAGASIVVVTWLAALAGAWLYALLQARLPH